MKWPIMFLHLKFSYRRLSVHITLVVKITFGCDFMTSLAIHIDFSFARNICYYSINYAFDTLILEIGQLVKLTRKGASTLFLSPLCNPQQTMQSTQCHLRLENKKRIFNMRDNWTWWSIKMHVSIKAISRVDIQQFVWNNQWSYIFPILRIMSHRLWIETSIKFKKENYLNWLWRIT